MLTPQLPEGGINGSIATATDTVTERFPAMERLSSVSPGRLPRRWAPDNVSMAAVAIGISGGGALSKFETTVLMTVEETLEAIRRAGSIGYRPPGA
jgi:hypothetical protein